MQPPVWENKINEEFFSVERGYLQFDPTMTLTREILTLLIA